MEKEIVVVVKVNSDEHAEQIRIDILKALHFRVNEWYVSKPSKPHKYIEDLFKEEMK